MPVHQNVLMSTRAKALACRRGDIRLGFCPSCGFVTNLAFDPSLVVYSPEYDNSQTHSPSFRAYLERLARSLVDRHGLHRKLIVEIGCGKGEFLTLLCRLGNNRGVGFDPSYVPRDDNRDATFVRDFYSERYAGYRGDLICCRHVLEHIPRPESILTPVRHSMTGNDGAVAFLEVPTLTWILRNVAFWDIFYEHCSYFTAGSLARLFAASGFIVTRVAEAFGGQYLWLEATLGGDGRSGPSPLPPVDSPADTLRDIGAFVKRFRARKEQTYDRIMSYVRSGERCVVWGAGAKGVTLLNTLRLTPGEVELVVDVNPSKQGKYVPGTGQEIVSPERLTSSRPGAILVMNPNYLAEIRGAVNRLGLAARVVSA